MKRETSRVLVVALLPPERDLLVQALREKLERDTEAERGVIEMLVRALERGELEALRT